MYIYIYIYIYVYIFPNPGVDIGGGGVKRAWGYKVRDQLLYGVVREWEMSNLHVE